MGTRERHCPLTKILSVALIAAILVQLPISVSAREPDHIAVLELHHRRARPDHTRKMTDRFREELSRYSNLKVLTRTETKAIFNYHKSVILETGHITPMQRRMSKAKRAYFELALKRSAQLTAEVIESSLRTSAASRDYRALLEAYTVGGIVAMAQNRKTDAKEAFRQLVFYNPAARLDKRYFAPSVIKKVGRAKDELKTQPLGGLFIKSKPAIAADVFVNGVYKGTTPLQLDGYPEGEHVVAITAANYGTLTKVVRVKAGKTQQVKFVQRWKGKDRRFPPDMVGFHRGQFAGMEQLIGAAAATAQAMRVKKLILVEVKKENGKDVVTAHMVDAGLKTFHRPQSVTVDDITEESAQASAILATQVLDEMNNSIMDDPKGLAAAPYYGDVILVGKRRRRSLLKNPWFWVGLGVAVAGGTTAALLLTRGTSTTGAINVIFR